MKNLLYLLHIALLGVVGTSCSDDNLSMSEQALSTKKRTEAIISFIHNAQKDKLDNPEIAKRLDNFIVQFGGQKVENLDFNRQQNPISRVASCQIGDMQSYFFGDGTAVAIFPYSGCGMCGGGSGWTVIEATCSSSGCTITSHTEMCAQ